MSSGDEVPAVKLRAMQIITIALILGVVFFVVVALVITANQPPAGGPPVVGDIPIVTLLACVFFLLQAGMSFFVPTVMEQQLLRQIVTGAFPPAAQVPPEGRTDAGSLLALRQTSLIVGLALIEGACFFGGVAYIVERHYLGLLVAGLGVGLILTRFPTEASIRQWLEAKKEELARARQGSEQRP
jgi:hypothetical protein